MIYILSLSVQIYIGFLARRNAVMSIDRHCDKCNLEVPCGTVLTKLCVDGMAHHLVDNISAAQKGLF